MTTPVLDPNELDPTGELAAEIERREYEYSLYVANQPIHSGNAVAYAPGHQVPISNVLKHGYFLNGQVSLREGKAHDPRVAATLPAEPVASEPTEHSIDPEG